MVSQLESWARPYYSAGGGRPRLFYVVFGNVQPRSRMLASQYRCSGVPPGVQMIGPGCVPEDHGSFREGAAWDKLVAHQAALADEVRSLGQCMIVKGEPAHDETLDYLRDAIGLVTWLLDNGGRYIYDAHGMQWWTPELWREKIFDSGLVVRRHGVISIAKETKPRTRCYHTRGMQKFGRPDIIVRNVPKQLNEETITLCRKLIKHMALGGVLRDGKRIKTDKLAGKVVHRRNDQDAATDNPLIEVKLKV